jgi:hypothetical protein
MNVRSVRYTGMTDCFLRHFQRIKYPQGRGTMYAAQEALGEGEWFSPQTSCPYGSLFLGNGLRDLKNKRTDA